MSRPTLSKTLGVVFALCAMTAISLPAQTFSSLASFDGTNGALPDGALVQGTDGNFYSTTYEGGKNTSPTCATTTFSGCGTVFKVTPAGTLTTLYNFCSQTGCSDGSNPGKLALASDGNFYGATTGTVFKITPSGMLTTLYSFCAQTNCADGSDPNGFVQGADGNFYGTTYDGGTNTSTTCGSGSGTVFKLTPAGTLTTLHSFDGTDGSHPGGLTQGTDGNFYGTTSDGGGREYAGTVFRITPAGQLVTLYSFCTQVSAVNCLDGYGPDLVLQGTDGNFYGTTYAGGGGTYCSASYPGNGCGTIFRITPGGTLTTLYSFCSQNNCADGSGPNGLVQGADGNFYGTANTGGAIEQQGTVFKITPSGTFTTLHSFDGSDGGGAGGLVQGTDGTFYGATGYYGSYGHGTVYSLAVGLGSFVETVPSSGATAATVVILGENLTGSTSVTFNETAATFTVVSSTEITATVPAGATTGTVKVTTPGGVLESNIPFQVTGVQSPGANLSPSSLVFPPQLVGSTGAPQAVTLTNSGNMTLTITSITASGGFAESNNCGSSVPTGGSCAINVTFTPSAGGPATGTLTITDNSATGGIQKVTLSGMAQDFTILVATGSSSSQSVSPGGTATYMLSLGSQGGLSGTVTLSCSGAPSEAQCTESPSSVTLSGNGSGTSTISVSTAAQSRVGWRMQGAPLAPGWWAGSLLIWMVVAMLIGMLAIGLARMHGEAERKRLWDTACFALALVLLAAMPMPACGGGSGGSNNSGSNSNGQQNQGTPAGTYNLTVTGTYEMGSSTLSQTQSLTLKVN